MIMIPNNFDCSSRVAKIKGSRYLKRVRALFWRRPLTSSVTRLVKKLIHPAKTTAAKELIRAKTATIIVTSTMTTILCRLRTKRITNTEISDKKRAMQGFWQ